jgi:hypothetical protein
MYYTKKEYKDSTHTVQHTQEARLQRRTMPPPTPEMMKPNHPLTFTREHRHTWKKPQTPSATR